MIGAIRGAKAPPMKTSLFHKLDHKGYDHSPYDQELPMNGANGDVGLTVRSELLTKWPFSSTETADSTRKKADSTDSDWSKEARLSCATDGRGPGPLQTT